MFNEILMCATLMSAQYMAMSSIVNQTVVEQNVAPDTGEFSSVINTVQKSKKNEFGAYPWEIIKIYEDKTYYIYNDYFRIGGKINKTSKEYHYFQGLHFKRKNITRHLMNPIDSQKVTYFNISNLLNALTYKIEGVNNRNRGHLYKWMYYRQIVLELQKESLEFNQLIFDLGLYGINC